MDVKKGFSLAEDKTFEAGSQTSFRVEGHRTTIDFGELSREYKLSCEGCCLSCQEGIALDKFEAIRSR